MLCTRTQPDIARQSVAGPVFGVAPAIGDVVFEACVSGQLWGDAHLHGAAERCQLAGRGLVASTPRAGLVSVLLTS